MLRDATIDDIPGIQRVRNSVTENTLSDPALVSDEDCGLYLTKRGKGWVYEINGEIAGFAIVDLAGKNIWALFIHPRYEGQGIGQLLHDTMLDWYFHQTSEKIWLGTAPNTRAELFYRGLGWTAVGVHGKGEIKFEMTMDVWSTRRLQNKQGCLLSCNDNPTSKANTLML
ncbi:GNAT family N-acetyltransferase [Segetibacter sp. 3557_3]|uniref:GNAT family N-acetyltransferase n=1 Tax=Segetibacter sp. 3557_3 TaxID=2547429 RepID=UPI0010591AC7|nr:GNAT family N-acetyltransferase [Segetibacter sp. 3557_3]TDH19983.1 GNAT family N-acetyltransferase [Segetibacter sp. 3557_3]